MLDFYQPRNKKIKSSESTSVETDSDISLPSTSSSVTDNFTDCLSDATDISLFKNKTLSDHEKLNVLQFTWIPDFNFQFPSKSVGKQNRKFSHYWLNKYKWLAYSKIENSAYCKICILFAPREIGMSSSQSVGQLVTSGFDN